MITWTRTSGGDSAALVIIATTFTGATAVKFAEADATSFAADSAAQIAAVLGSGASGKTSVATAAGSATGVDDFSFLPAFFAGPVGSWPIDGIIGVAIFIASIPWRLMLSGRKRHRYAVRIASANSVYA